MMTRQELAYQFIPFLVQSFGGDNFLFGDFERWKKILADEHITEFDFDWAELKYEVVFHLLLKKWYYIHSRKQGK